MTKIQISKHKKRGVQNALFWSLNIDGFVKSPKRTHFQISHLVNSIGYNIEIR